MSDDQKERFNVSAEEILRYPWQDAVLANEQRDCQYYYKVFSITKHREAGDELGVRVFSLLGAVASFHADYDNRANPYTSMWSKPDGTRSLIPEDLTEKDLDALGGIVEEIKDTEFRARVADVLWIRRKDFKAAQIAIEAFLKSAVILEPIPKPLIGDKIAVGWLCLN